MVRTRTSAPRVVFAKTAENASTCGEGICAYALLDTQDQHVEKPLIIAVPILVRMVLSVRIIQRAMCANVILLTLACTARLL